MMSNLGHYLVLGGVIGVEYNGDGVIQACQDTVSAVCKDEAFSVFVSSDSASAASQVDNFYNYADMQMNA